ncbi:M23 family metallopeptidase [Microbacterium sp. NPDC057650]|uniref:M23 family metallopeptidase n=1 Tax=unclassified Microbacterium TaxID=2609290 RepID=UPI0036732BF5
MSESAVEQPFVGRRARRAGVAPAAVSDAAPWRSAIADAGAHRASGAVEPLAAESVAAGPVVEAEPIVQAGAAELKSERLIFDEPSETDQARAEQVRAERVAAEAAAAEQARIEQIAAEQAAAERAHAEQVAARAQAEHVAAEQAAAERAQAKRIAAAQAAERVAAERNAAERAAAERAHAEQLAADAHAEQLAAQQAAAQARAEEEARLAQVRAERAAQARAEQAAAQHRAAQASASHASESVSVTGPAVENDARATDPSVDAFSAAAEAFGFSADDLDETVEPLPEAYAPEEAKQDDRADSEHVAPRRGRRFGRKIVAAGASLGVMAVAGLMLVSTTLPSEAVAAGQGQGAQSVTSLTAAEDTTQRKAVEKDIQAFVAPSDLEDEEIARSGEYSSMSMADLAAEEGIHYSTSVYTNDTTAAIQWPFAVGTGMSWPYGMRRGRMHQGIDLIPGNGAPIQAIADGVVRKATENGGGYGVTVYIDHMVDGQVVTSHYSHMQHGSIRVKTGQHVKVGDIVGLVGNTGHSYGAHLHFELLRNGQTFDPLPWMKKNAGRHDGVGPIS